ncbi:hypothetical protein [Streptomyces thermoviolaceus]|uniref:hypothetical protein n=1 Tax=Streptomyces thermoviolaceus TaxID=1952 RepID=UPI00167A65E1|nr:hypothetical protein [Streptomyces thermoviolaceus]GGV80436.1 hypothetical protein GCM10010499_43360 [Streptomyces thermoviolaceus subsp. apingens]
MTDHVARPSAPATRQARVAELHRLARADYASTAHLRRQNPTWPVSPAAALAARNEPRVPSDLDVAISVAQQLLGSDSVLSLREALRLLLRALGAEPIDEAEAVRRSVDAQFPTIAAFLARERGEGR